MCKKPLRLIFALRIYAKIKFSHSGFMCKKPLRLIFALRIYAKIKFSHSDLCAKNRFA